MSTKISYLPQFEKFWDFPEVSRQSRKRPDNLESFQTTMSVSKESGRFLDNLTYLKITFRASEKIWQVSRQL